MIRSENPLIAGDLGFRVFRLDSSNIRAWTPNKENLSGTLLENLEHIQPGRSNTDVLYEVLLKLGLDLCVPIEQKLIASKTVHSIGGGALLACLDEHISVADAEPLALGMAQWREQQGTATETTAVFRDSAFERCGQEQSGRHLGAARREARAQLVRINCRMKLHFESDLPYQAAAIEAVCDLFRGQEVCRSVFTVTAQALTDSGQQSFEGKQFTAEGGINNALQLLVDEELSENLQKVQLRNGLQPSDPLNRRCCINRP